MFPYMGIKEYRLILVFNLHRGRLFHVISFYIVFKCRGCFVYIPYIIKDISIISVNLPIEFDMRF